MQLLNDKVVNLIRKARGHTDQNPNLMPQKVQKEHKTIYRAIADKNPVKARKAVLTHIKNAGDRLGVKLKATI